METTSCRLHHVDCNDPVNTTVITTIPINREVSLEIIVLKQYRSRINFKFSKHDVMRTTQKAASII